MLRSDFTESGYAHTLLDNVFICHRELNHWVAPFASVFLVVERYEAKAAFAFQQSCQPRRIFAG
jgi:hypothetical protein